MCEVKVDEVKSDKISGSDFYLLGLEEVYRQSGTTSDGLSDGQIAERRQAYGQNVLPKDKKRPFFLRFLDQFKNFMILILLAAAVISAFSDELASSIIIVAVVVLNSLLGVVQEGRAEKALESLQKLSAPHAKVRRGGVVTEIDSADLVPGDIVLLEAGSAVPADLRLTQAASLKIEEAALTGESVPSGKNVGAIAAKAALGDRKNMAFSGSNVVYGRGEGVVTATGTATEVGKIAAHLSGETKLKTPLQQKLDGLSGIITKGVLAIVAVMFVVGLLRLEGGLFPGGEFNREGVLDIFMVAVALAVSAIPEGLVAVVTILLAIGVQRMAAQNAIIRRLSAVETLGSTEIICSDKTGTLTQNKMTVKSVFFGGKNFTDEQYEGGKNRFMLALSLCNDADERADGSYLGDPTETALTRFAAEKGIKKSAATQAHPRIAELPFDSERKRMSTLHEFEGGVIQLVKGAPDVLLALCTHYAGGGGEVLPLDDGTRQSFLQEVSAMSKRALRVLSFAYREHDTLPETIDISLENNLIFTGLTGMIDPPRPEVFEAVKTCKAAGMRAVMITGDHRDTAVAIAMQLGIIDDESQALTGEQIDGFSQKEFEDGIDRYNVFARVAPEHKVRIVKAWQKRGKVVAMTGDGVNDAPALKAADIGVGMGITGTDVSKGVSSMVLTDDNFATIVVAVKEGRTIYSNIQRAVQYLLSTNIGEVVSVFIGSLILAPGTHLLLPVHLLWINLVTDSLPAIALGFEPPEKDVMAHPPRKADAGLLSGGVGITVLYQGVFVGLITLATYLVGARVYGSPQVGQTMAFLSIAAWSMFQTFNLKSNTQSILKTGITSNKNLLLAILVSSLLQVAVMVLPFAQSAFSIVPLSAQQWLVTLGIAFLIIPLVEIAKVFRRRAQARAESV